MDNEGDSIFSAFFGSHCDCVGAELLGTDKPGNDQNIYVIGTTDSLTFPVTPDGFQTTLAGAGFYPHGFLLKLDSTGSKALYVHEGGIAVDSRGAHTMCNSTIDPDLPVSAGAFQGSFGGVWDAYVARISPDGSYFEALTYWGGNTGDFCEAVRLDASGNVYVFGETSSRFFPVTPDAYQRIPVPMGRCLSLV